MLISFTVGNYRSIWEPQTLSMEPASISDYPQNLIQQGGRKLLSSAVIYGANASGKSNILRAMSIMRQMILEGFERSSVSELPYDPFLLHLEGPQKPTLYEVVFLVNELRYRYGFEADRTRIHGEWLFVAKKHAEKPLFVRQYDGIEVMSAFKEGKDLEEKTRDNALFISVVDQFNGQITRSIMSWFRRFFPISGINHDESRNFTTRVLSNAKSAGPLNKFLSTFDLGFELIRVNKENFQPTFLPEYLPQEVINEILSDMKGEKVTRLKTQHAIFDDNSQFIDFIEFDSSWQESDGTNKIIDLSGPMFAALREGGVLVVDELDAKLHPLLTRAIVLLFQNADTNSGGGQLVFATHDTNVLRMCNLRRDQIYFTEKNNRGVSTLYSLVEYDIQGQGMARKDRSFEKDYINGRYGAIPFLGDFTFLTDHVQENQFPS